MSYPTCTGRDIFSRNRQGNGLHSGKHIENCQWAWKSRSDNTVKGIMQMSDDADFTVYSCLKTVLCGMDKTD